MVERGEGADKRRPVRPDFDVRALLVSNALGLLLLLVWVIPATRAAIAPFDDWVFRQLNGSLTLSPAWAQMWAFLNTRKFDLLAGLLMGLFFVIPGLAYRGREWIVAGFEFAGVFLAFSLARLLVSGLSAPRPSPSRHHYPNFNSLLELVPGVEGKVFSDHSFPSDHAAVVFVWALFLLYSSRRPGRWLAVPYALLISTPRLVGGAHWVSDVLLGSVPLAAFGFSWGYFTPLRARLRALGEKLCVRLFGKPEAA